MTQLVPRTGETVSPTPPTVYEPRIWAVRIIAPGAGRGGVGFLFKAPYGQGMNAATVLARAATRRQITKFSFGPATTDQMRELDENAPGWRKNLRRFDEAFERVGVQLGIDWSA